MNGCDDINPDNRHFDVTFLLPVTLRFWAEDEASAREQFTDVSMEVMGPQIASSTGFLENLIVKEVATAEGLRNIGHIATEKETTCHGFQ